MPWDRGECYREPAKPEAWLGDCKRQSRTELEGRNQVNTQDLEPHFKEGSGRWNVDKLSDVGDYTHPRCPFLQTCSERISTKER